MLPSREAQSGAREIVALAGEVRRMTLSRWRALHVAVREMALPLAARSMQQHRARACGRRSKAARIGMGRHHLRWKYEACIGARHERSGGPMLKSRGGAGVSAGQQRTCRELQGKWALKVK